MQVAMNFVILLALFSCIFARNVSFTDPDWLKWVNRNATTSDLQKIGSRLYYIEYEEKLFWWGARMACHEKRGNLLYFGDLKETKAVQDHLQSGERYWVDLLYMRGNRFLSLSTGNHKGKFPLWQKGEPNTAKGAKRCAYGQVNNGEFRLYVESCINEYLFICEITTPEPRRRDCLRG